LSRVYDSLKCQRLNQPITNESVANLDASRRILDTQCEQISVLANTKNF